jgi:hypothetical protein
MTIEIMPAADSPWRGAYPAPKDLDLENGPWCSMDLGAGLIPEQLGWVCASCGAHWDQHGRNGRWLTASTVLIGNAGQLVERDAVTAEAVRLRRVDRAVAGCIVAGAVLGVGFATGRQLRGADVVPEDLLWAVSLMALGLLLIAVSLVLAWNRRQGRQDDAGKAGA